MMKIFNYNLKQQTQAYVLRLFVDSVGADFSTAAHSFYTGAHCGTFSRMRQ